MNKMSKNDESLIAGIILGLLGLAVLASLFRREARCPVCNNSIPIGVLKCRYCGSDLKWN